MIKNIAKIRRALLSVTDKRGIALFAKSLADFGVEIISTGGTAEKIREAGVKVIDVSDVTGFPECLEGRLKTLHPKVHGALLYERDKPQHLQTIEDLGIGPIDLLAVNLYKFENIVGKADVPMDQVIEAIDVGGPAMIRGAAKNYAHVTVVTDPDLYHRVSDEIYREGGTTLAFRKACAVRVFALTARYDAMIRDELNARFENEEQ